MTMSRGWVTVRESRVQLTLSRRSARATPPAALALRRCSGVRSFHLSFTACKKDTCK